MATVRVKQRGGEPRFYVRWRDGRRFIEKAAGPAWMVPVGDPDAKRNAAGAEIGDRVGEWTERRGRAPEGYLTPRNVHAMVPDLQEQQAREKAESSSLTPEQRKAQRLRERIAALEAEAERLEGDQAPTFADAAEAWFAHRRDVKRLSASSLRDYRLALDARVLPVLGEVKLRALDERAVVGFRDALAAEQRTTKEGKQVAAVSPRTINKYLTVVDGILRHACKSEGLGGFALEVNAAAEVEKIADRKVDTTEYLTPFEVQQVVDALAAGRHRDARTDADLSDAEQAARKLENVRDATAVAVAGFAGLRQGELIALRWADVSLSDERLRVRRSITRGVESTPKGKRARDVPMAQPVATALAKLDAATREYAEVVGIPAALRSDDHVFAGLDGRPLDPDNLAKRYRSACKAIGLRVVRFHGLRHSFTTAAREGFAADRVQLFAGHQDAATAQRYAHPRSRSTDAKVLTETLAREVAASSPASA